MYIVALFIAIPRAGESKVIDSKDLEVERFVVSISVHILLDHLTNNATYKGGISDFLNT